MDDELGVEYLMDEMGVEWWLNLQFPNLKINEHLQLEKKVEKQLTRQNWIFRKIS